MTLRTTFPQVTSVAMAALLTLLVAAGCSSSDDVDPEDVSATAAELVNGFILAVQEEDIAALDSLLHEEYLSQRADGQPMSRQEVLNDPVVIDSFDVSDEVTAVQVVDTLAVRYGLTVVGPTYETVEQPRLSTFVWDDGRWQLLAHANYNDPISD